MVIIIINIYLTLLLLSLLKFSLQLPTPLLFIYFVYYIRCKKLTFIYTLTITLINNKINNIITFTLNYS